MLLTGLSTIEREHAFTEQLRATEQSVNEWRERYDELRKQKDQQQVRIDDLVEKIHEDAKCNMCPTPRQVIEALKAKVQRLEKQSINVECRMT